MSFSYLLPPNNLESTLDIKLIDIFTQFKVCRKAKVVPRMKRKDRDCKKVSVILTQVKPKSARNSYEYAIVLALQRISDMNYTAEAICEILKCRGQIVSPDAGIEHLLTDSRNVVFGDRSLFFAITGKQLDGHHYIKQAHEAGVKNFVVEHIPSQTFSDSNYLLVENSIKALHKLTSFHRKQFSIPVVGITGSNGKTIVKEWLYHLLKIDLDIVRSPKSYNSQIGVPLSVWMMDEKNELAIFEAGISLPDEMDALENIIHPEIGIITNITKTHNEGFTNDIEKTKEKLKLFTNSKSIIYRKDYTIIDELISSDQNKLTWSTNVALNADILIKDIEILSEETLFTLLYKNFTLHFAIPFIDQAAFENAIHALITALLIHENRKTLNDKSIENITLQAKNLPPVSMRLELIKGINNCIIINDTYSADLASLDIALHFLKHHSIGSHKTVILSDFDESGEEASVLYKKIANLLKELAVENFYGIGENIFSHKNYFKDLNCSFFADTTSFIKQFNSLNFENEIILLKGARRFQLEKISALLALKSHGTVLKIQLNNLVHNLNMYRSLLKPGVKTMVMVKAFSYGSGQAEIARVLSHNRVDHLAVAYADEGVELRRQGIKLPIMVMNPEPESFDQILQFQLEPELYSFRILNNFLDVLAAKQSLESTEATFPFPIHIKLDTGMHRLGFEEKDIAALLEIISKNPQIKIASVFSHLSSADDRKQDAFTAEQINKFENWSQKITQSLSYPVLLHIVNSPGITQFAEAQYNMVRLGIGLYGVDPSESMQNKLLPVSSLHTTIAQIKEITAGDSVGYGRSFIADKNMRIATINIGYADGFSRKMGNGAGIVSIRGKMAPVIGKVCMDMTMVDISSISGVKEGDEVELFGSIIPITDYAARQGTIAYEVMTSISQRVKRIYLQD